MRRTDREIPTRDAIDAVIRCALVCRLGLAAGDEPYIVPVSFGYDGAAIYFHTARDGKKIDFMAVNRRVCFEFEHDVELRTDPDKPCQWTFSYESVIGYGTVTELTAEAEKLSALNRIMLQYSGEEWEFDAGQVANTRTWRIDIESITGKRSQLKAV